MTTQLTRHSDHDNYDWHLLRSFHRRRSCRPAGSSCHSRVAFRRPIAHPGAIATTLNAGRGYNLACIHRHITHWVSRRCFHACFSQPRAITGKNGTQE